MIGGGTVYPEINFTLPSMVISHETMDEVYAQYTQMITEACKRAVELYAPGLVVEFELLPELTQVPEWGANITRILSNTLLETEAKHGLKKEFLIQARFVSPFIELKTRYSITS